jgi:hypothetical protein
LIGIQWALMTHIFECVFGFYIANKSIDKILQTLKILEGDLFIIVLLVSLLSPLIVTKFKAYRSKDLLSKT